MMFNYLGTTAQLSFHVNLNHHNMVTVAVTMYTWLNHSFNIVLNNYVN